MEGYYEGAFQVPPQQIKLQSGRKQKAPTKRKIKESPKKISPAVKAKRKRPFGAQEPQPKKNQKTIPKNLQENPPLVNEGKGPSNIFQLFTSSANRQNGNDIRTANNGAIEPKKSYMDFIHTPPDQNKGRKRQRLTPTPVHNYLTSSSPAAFVTPSERPPLKARSRTNLKNRFCDEADSVNISDSEWCSSPPLDWSLKTKLSLVSPVPFGFNSGNLKSSEESSGISAFARCIDPRKVGCGRDEAMSQSQLDTSLGAQFHQCCLYWAHPSLPGVPLFPRDFGSNFSFSNNVSGNSTSSSSVLNGIKMEQKVLDIMFNEWVDAFRSLFQLLRTRQAPYFYLCANQFNALFCAAGTQGLEQLHIYVTPSTKGFRDALTHEGIAFSTPAACPSKDEGELGDGKKGEESEVDDDEPADRWLDEMGISQDVSLSHRLNSTTSPKEDEKNKAALLLIVGSHSLAFFNFLINSKNLLVSPIGHFAGLPPTLVSPVTFYGAALKSLKVKSSTSGKASTGDLSYVVDISGPILPHVMHNFCLLLGKTSKEFKIRVTSLNSTTNLNLNTNGFRPVINSKNGPSVQANAFELQNLSDCGLSGELLELFVRPQSVDTITSQLECKNGLYKWS